MRMLRFFKFLLVLLLLLLSVSGSTFVREPKVSIKRTNIVGLDASGVEIEFYLGIRNPNSFDLSLLGYTYDLKVMALPLASGGLQESILFKGGSETDVRLPVRVKLADLIEVLKRRPDPDRVPYQLNARLQISTFAGDMTIPIESSSTFSVPETYRPDYYLNRLKSLFK
jgi:LEA14-like dessication related protein